MDMHRYIQGLEMNTLRNIIWADATIESQHRVAVGLTGHAISVAEFVKLVRAESKARQVSRCDCRKEGV